MTYTKAVVLFFANFLLFGIITVLIGGDAVNGHTEDGRYFLSAYGRETEVSQGLYNYSLAHTRITIATFFAFFVATIVRNLSNK